MKPIFLPVLIFILSLTACMHQGVKPDWVDGKGSEYPASRYLVGRGEHIDQARARDYARADLAKIFQVAIDEQSIDITKYSSKKIGRDTIEQLESEASRDISARTEQVISGVDIADIWYDSENKAYHVLAALDRIQMTRNLRQEINQQDEVTQQHLTAARQTSSLITQIGAASRAIETQIARDSNQRLMKIVDRSGVGVPEKYNFGKLINDRATLLKRLKIKPKASRDDLGGLKRTLAGALASVGFSHKGGADADYELDAQVALQPIEDKEGWFWIRGSIDINLKDTKTGESQGSHRWNIKVSAQNHASAKKRAKSEVDKLLKKELKAVIIGFGQPD